MTEFVNMWKNYVNFSDRTTVRGYWMAFLFNFLAALIVGIVSSVIKLPILASLYSLAAFLPGLGLTVRRLRDAGRPWYHIFFACIPLAGPIILIVFLCKPSVPDDGVPVV